METASGTAHRIISGRQMARELERRALGYAPFSTTIDDQLRFVVDDFRAAGFSDMDISRILQDQYRMLNKLGVSYTRPHGF